MIKKFLYEHFHILEHHTSVRTEILAGITNYFTLIYLVFLVPEIVMNAFPEAIDASGAIIGDYVISNGLTANEMLIALTSAAFLAAGLGSIIFGMFINVPFVQGPSLAISTFITYTICQGFGYSYYQALAIVFLSGICFFVLSILGVEKKIHNAIPKNIKYAVTAGIGLFIAFTGLQKAHIINFSSLNSVHLFNMADITNKYTIEAFLAICGVLFITVLLKRNVHGAIFIGKIACILVAIPLGLIKKVNVEKFNYSFNLDKVFLKIDFKGLIDFSTKETFIHTGIIVLIVIFSICMMDIFETMSMLIATDSFVKISKEGFVKKRIPQILEIDSMTTSVGAALGATSVSTYIESTTGIIEGGRTGLTAIVTGVLFLFSIFFTPFVSLVPSAATATTLIIAGVLMMNIIKLIDFEDAAEAVPAFFTMFLMPLTNSLLVGISFGVISYVIIHIFLGKHCHVNKMLYFLAVLFFIILLLMPR